MRLKSRQKGTKNLLSQYILCLKQRIYNKARDILQRKLPTKIACFFATTLNCLTSTQKDQLFYEFVFDINSFEMTISQNAY